MNRLQKGSLRRSLPSNVARAKCQRDRRLNWQALQPGCSSPQDHL